MALNPINELISYIMSEMTSIYTDFARFDISSRDILKFLRRETLVNANEIIKDPLKKIHNSLISAVLIDINRVYDGDARIGIMFSLILVAFCGVMLIEIHFFFIVKVENKINVLIYMIRIIESVSELHFSDGNDKAIEEDKY